MFPQSSYEQHKDLLANSHRWTLPKYLVFLLTTVILNFYSFLFNHFIIFIMFKALTVATLTLASFSMRADTEIFHT